MPGLREKDKSQAKPERKGILFSFTNPENLAENPNSKTNFS